jgi:hypothetical protein
MNITLRFRLGIVLALAAALAGCEGPVHVHRPHQWPTLVVERCGPHDLRGGRHQPQLRIHVGGLVDRHQVQSFPALFATQIGKSSLISGQGTFTFPAINGDGILPLLEIRSYNPPALSNSGRVLGSPTNFTQPSAITTSGSPGRSCSTSWTARTTTRPCPR